MESTPGFLNILLEWLSWVLLFFAWAILTRVAMRRYRKKNQVRFIHERRTYYLSMSIGIIVFIMVVLFVLDPIIGYYVSENNIAMENSPIYFLALAILLFFTLPFLITNIICRLSKKETVDTSMKI
ncbi:MAG: hypothetical protein IPP46_13105 [Bacteroidetes bacterium]|nr:hypothetical protein [Bacteroidota bacterium]